MDPFQGLHISNDWRQLFDIKERQPCRKCSKSRKYFCYTCYTLNSDLENKIPSLKLPFKIDIIKHSQEIAGKSTAIHAALLAPQDVTIYIYPDIPKYTENDKVILIYPGKLASTLDQFYDSNKKRMKHNETTKLSRLITHALFIDSTWNQTSGILKNPMISKLPCVKLKIRLSQFWRHQRGSPRWFLATIEAIHQLLVEYIEIENKSNEENYDNLLYFFRFMYEQIHQFYEHDKLMSYKRPINI